MTHISQPGMAKDRFYDGDPVLQGLIREAKSDSDVIGLALMGSRAVGDAVPESDYDIVFVVTDDAMTRYEGSGDSPKRGKSILPPIDTTDIWHESPRSLNRESVVSWMLPAWAESYILYDLTGQTKALIDGLRKMSSEESARAVSGWYDAYLNSLYRSLKCWQRGNEIGARLEASHSADYLVHTLFALEQEWRPYSSRLRYHLHKLEGQGWEDGEVGEILLDLIATGGEQRQRDVARRVILLLEERGFGAIYAAWNGKIDQLLI